ncbi:DUF2189 domain-containing protein [Pontibaca salina]|uniref:DUF2189 domain-containing protein n=1 Tax=Pontibaca salina TaxID=2795731 RepID=A0A934HTF0_9RHOB|nr:DUF2189 domain-containing protein [Pontibaca salina]MBI6630516.1 DUF2189 domain-containing protein [Pontibaca salina]
MLSDTPAPPDPLPNAPEGLPKIVPPAPRDSPRRRNLPPGAALGWLWAGWRDLWTNPLPSLLYGLVITLISLTIVLGLSQTDLDHFIFPALAGFMVVGPFFASGLYVKSSRLERGEHTGYLDMIFPRPRSGYQGLFLGVLLLSLFMLWIRSAVLIYALFFGVNPFPGLDDLVPMLLFSPTGWALLLVGTVVGALFAAFAFAVSVFAVPMLLKEETDALSAMGISIALTWDNLRVMLVWGTIVAGLITVSVLTGFLALIVIFPLLGHGTWHVYRAIRVPPEGLERVFVQPA